MGGFDFEGNLGDLFEAFFGNMSGAPGGRGRRRGPVPGADAEVSLNLPFVEAVFGAQRELSVRLPVTCDVCGGNGAEPGTEPITCPDCQGTGEIRRIRQSLLGQVVTAVACGRCQGLGESIPSPCRHCHGEGRRMEDRSFSVSVPAGVEDGSTLRLADRGPAGPRGGPNGSLFVHLQVVPDERFERVNDDLHTEVHLTMTQAALGSSVSVETLEDPQTIEVSAGTQGGHVVKIKGLGVPHLRGRGRGDLFAHLVVDTPTQLDETQADLLRQLAAARGEEVHPPGSDGVFSRIRSAFG
jgi:molecular chaperone DnaJ